MATQSSGAGAGAELDNINFSGIFSTHTLTQCTDGESNKVVYDKKNAKLSHQQFL